MTVDKIEPLRVVFGEFGRCTVASVASDSAVDAVTGLVGTDTGALRSL